MRPAAIALNYSVKDIWPDVQQIIGASLSEPHTSELNGGFFIYISAVRTSFRKCKLTLFYPETMRTPIRAGKISKTIT